MVLLSIYHVTGLSGTTDDTSVFNDLNLEVHVFLYFYLPIFRDEQYEMN